MDSRRRVYIKKDALMGIRNCAASSTGEVGGVLIGSAGRDKCVQICDFIEAEDTLSSPRGVTFTRKAWKGMRRMARKHRGTNVVGWYHSHPSLGVFLSAADLRLHRAFFGKRYQVAMVIDPKSNECAVFGWKGRNVGVCRLSYMV
jgi:proteasome lid subunit RPN8/RPN11